MRFLFVHSPVVGPTTWQWVAEALASRGHWTVVPDLRGAALTGDPLAFASAASAAEVSGDDVVVVGHSGAGSVLPIIAAALPTVVRTVFVDAGLPPCEGAFSMGGEFLETLRGLAMDRVLPTWARWWGEGVMEMLVPDDARQQSIEQELPTVPLAFFEAPLTAPAGWCSRRAAFVLLSEPYRSDAERARALQWPVVERIGTHLDVANDEEGIADILERIV